MSIFTFKDIRAESMRNKVNSLKEKNPFNFTIATIKNKLAGNKLVSVSSKQTLQGSIDKISPIDKKKNIIRIIGWIYDMKEQTVPRWLIVLDENSNVIGYIITGRPRKDVEMQYGKNATGSGFIGYIRYLKTPSTLFIVDELGDKIFKEKYQRE